MIWYPYQQLKHMPQPIEIVSGEGVHLITRSGQRLIDTTSSWWSMIHGYQHPVIVDAIREQASKLCHVMLGGLTHDPVAHLTEKLQSILPGSLNHCFYSDSGSVAVEVALKMAQQYHANLDQPRSHVLALTKAYHGDTFKAMAVGDDADYHRAFPDKTDVSHINPTIEELEQAFLEPDHLSCLIVEPLLQGAGGMQMYELDFLIRARQLCDQTGVLLIFDEVATGFGRTGNRFVADLVTPDIIVLGKALTGGHIGHAVTVASDKVFDAFYADDPALALMHGPTFMGNPLACRAALASIELFEQGNYLARIKHQAGLAEAILSQWNHPAVKQVRIMGGCVAIEVHDSASLAGYQEYAIARGIYARPFGTCLYAMVPYIISDDDYEMVIQTMKDWFN